MPVFINRSRIFARFQLLHDSNRLIRILQCHRQQPQLRRILARCDAVVGEHDGIMVYIGRTYWRKLIEKEMASPNVPSFGQPLGSKMMRWEFVSRGISWRITTNALCLRHKLRVIAPTTSRPSMPLAQRQHELACGPAIR